MAPDGEQASAPAPGPTTIFIPRGGTRQVTVWVEDDARNQLLNSYQVIWPKVATPLPGATGSVNYVDEPGFPVCSNFGPFVDMLCDPADPRACGDDPASCDDALGNTLFVDRDRLDYVFFGSPATYAFLSEGASMNPELFGAISGVNPYDAGISIPQGIRYLAQFDLAASDDASGTFTLEFNQFPPFAEFYEPQGTEFFIEDLQPLSVAITICGDGAIEGDEQCDDGNLASGDGCSFVCAWETADVPAMTARGVALLFGCLVVGIVMMVAWQTEREP